MFGTCIACAHLLVYSSGGAFPLRDHSMKKMKRAKRYNQVPTSGTKPLLRTTWVNVLLASDTADPVWVTESQGSNKKKLSSSLCIVRRKENICQSRIIFFAVLSSWVAYVVVPTMLEEYPNLFCMYELSTKFTMCQTITVSACN